MKFAIPNKTLGRKSRSLAPLASIRSPHNRRTFFTEMTYEPVVAAYLLAVKTLLNQLRLSVIDEDGDRVDILPANFQKSLVEAILERAVYGSAVLEVSYTPGLEITDVGLRSITTLDLIAIKRDEMLNITEIKQINALETANKFAILPREKLIILNESPDLLTGSLLSGGVVAYNAIKRLREIEVIGADRAMVGVPHFTTPGEPTAEQLGSMSAIAENLHASDNLMVHSPAASYTDPATGATVNTGYGFQLISTETAPLGQLSNTISRYERTLATTLLSQFLMLGQGTGSYALSKDQTDLFQLSLLGLIDEAIDDVEKDLLVPLAEELGSKPMYLVRSGFNLPSMSDMSQLLPLVSAGLFDVERAKEMVGEMVESELGGI